MFRILGILVVALILIAVIAYAFNKEVIKPARNRRHVTELEAENERLDKLIDVTTIPQKKEKT